MGTMDAYFLSIYFHFDQDSYSIGEILQNIFFSLKWDWVKNCYYCSQILLSLAPHLILLDIFFLESCQPLHTVLIVLR